MEEGCIGSLLCDDIITFILYRGTVMLLAQPGRKPEKVTEDFEFYISYL